GMTIVGTYFFYTQLSVFVIKMLQKNRFLFWKKTNIITISSLAYRLKDNARMFFMVTIVSTVAFCAVGTLASMNVMNKQFKEDYPAAISYTAMDNQPIQQKNLHQIKAEISKKGIPYKIISAVIKNVEVASENTGYRYPVTNIDIISFSDYKNIAKSAGFHVPEKNLKGNEAIAMLSSHFQMDYKSVTYTLKQDNIKLHAKKQSQNVTIPFRSGLIVSDALYQKLKPVKTNTFTGFFTKYFEKTAGIAKNLAPEGSSYFSENHHYEIQVSGTMYENQMNMFKMMLFVALLVGAVFFIAAGSFLYFRLYADLDYDRRQYLTIKKVGLTDRELNKIVIQQLALLFFVPIIVAFIHSAFAFMALQSYYTLSIASEMIIVLASFLIAQLIYFFLIRYRYLRNLKKTLI
ncbi:MAG: ABC transporter permease, partial [Heyndrickxia sp.]